MEQEQTTKPVVLPDEVQSLSLRVSNEKREEVNSVLTQIFSGTADWKNQVDSIVVKDPSDKMGMNLAKTARLNAKNARLSAEKVFDGKREEVQSQMLSFQTEDKLWLKAKQTMQILFKEIEQSAEYKEKTAERYEIEQHELKVQTHLAKLASVDPEISRQEIEYMSDASFDVFFSGLLKAKEDTKQKEKEEQEKLKLAESRKQRDQNRFQTFAGTGFKFALNDGTFSYAGASSYVFEELCELDDDKFLAQVNKATKLVLELKKSESAEKERLQKIAEEKESELKKQKAESDAKFAAEEAKRVAYEAQATKENKILNDARIAAEQKAAKLEARNKELRPFIVFIRNYDKVLNLPDNEYVKALSDIKKGAELQWEDDRNQEAKRQEEENSKLLLAKAPKKEKLSAWIESLALFAPSGEESDLLVRNILSKFDGFKKWAKSEVEKL